MITMLKQNEKDLISGIDPEEAWNHVEYLSTLDKTSGTMGERQAHDYVQGKLAEYGVPFNEYVFDSYLSHPKEGTLEVVSPSVADFKAITAAFSKSTDGEKIEAELVFIDLPPGTLFGGFEGLIDLYKEIGVEGKITVVHGLSSPTVMWAAQQAGALGQVHISGDEVIHEMIITTIWGTPTNESLERMPKIPAVAISKSSGEQLLKMLEQGEVRARISTRLDMRWRKIPITVAEIEGEEDQFMLVHGHMDSWYVGTTDNCTGNAACLELARLFGVCEGKMKRGLRVAWWSGHSTGRYSGSTWYADNLFHDLKNSCFISMNIDSPGVKGATEVRGGGLMGTAEFIGEAIKDAVDIDAPVGARSMRAGDQSFYGIGVPNVGVSAAIPIGSPLHGDIIGGGGGGWWWHSANDTVDKGDKDNLFRDVKMQALSIHRLCNAEVIPFNFTPVAAEFNKEAIDIQTAIASGTFNLTTVLDKVRDLSEASERMNEALGKAIENEETVTAVNEALLRVAHILTSTLYTYAGYYEQDPAYSMGKVPALQAVRGLAGLDPEGSEALFLKTKLIREINKVNDMLDQAIEYIWFVVDIVEE